MFEDHSLQDAMRNAPLIGMFDSGIGGLSVWREVVRLLPDAPVVYVSDNAFCPYGPRPAEEVIERARKISRFLIGQGCRLVVAACNTATAAAIDALREIFPVPFVGMEPAVKPAALHSRTGVVGVLATQGTFGGRLYRETARRFASRVQVMEQAGEGLVELVEQGLTDAPQVTELLHKYIDPMMAAGADHLVLGCTHYPFLIPAVERIVCGRMAIVDPASAVAQQVRALYPQTTDTDAGALPVPQYRFYATGPDTALRACCGRMVLDSALMVFHSCFNIS